MVDRQEKRSEPAEHRTLSKKEKEHEGISLILGTAAILSLPGVAMGSAGQPDPAPAQAMVNTQAVVTGVDRDYRTITLVMPDGREQSLVVDTTAGDAFGQVRVGETVRVRYSEEVSLGISTVRAAPGIYVEATVIPGQSPVKQAEAAGVRTMTVATLDKVSSDGSRVTLKMPDGETRSLEISDPRTREKLKRREVREGDQVEITYNCAPAVVEKAGGR